MTASKPNKGFPGGAVDKNLPANTGDMSSIPDLGRFHMLGGVGWQLSSCATTTEPVLCHKRSHHNEKSENHN